MQTEVPALPVVCSDGCKRLTRNIVEEPRITAASLKSQSACKNAAILLSRRKQLHPLIGGPYYKNSARVYTIGEPARTLERNPVGQRVLSAKMLRVKQLQNQLTDAHYHLNELANENRLLKALQKRQDSALQRYEGTNAELPRIINSHHEELRVLQAKYKKLKAQHKDTCDLLKEKENELHALQAQNKHLLQLSKDRNLGEREKLQGQVSDLNHRIKRQNETIQLLHRKLALEGKSLRHQLNSEVAKNKAAQRHLNKTMEKLKGLEDLLDNREKKLYYSGQLPIFGKRKNMTSQSLMNLAADGSTASSLIKAVAGNRRLQDHETHDKSLPTLAEYESSANPKLSETSTNLATDSLPLSPKTETMASLDQVRKFRLQKSPQTQKLSATERLRERINETEFENENIEDADSHGEYFQSLHANIDPQDISAHETEIGKFNHEMEKRKESAYKLPREIREEFGYSTSGSDTEDGNDQRTARHKSEETDPTTASKELHARLTSKIGDGSEGKAVSYEREERKPSFTEKELEKFVNEKLKFKRESILQEPVKRVFSKADCKAEMRQLKAAAGITESDSETDSVSQSNKEEENYDYILRNAPDDSEGENLNHPIEHFLKFDTTNRSDSGSEADKPSKMRMRTKTKSLDAKFNASASRITNEEMRSRSPDDRYETGKQRLMDITKSWSELQEKIMRERETSENQIKALESELDDDITLERKAVRRGSKDNLKESLEQRLMEIERHGKKINESRRNSIPLGNMNFGIEPSENLMKNSESFGKEPSKIDDSAHEESETVVGKESFALGTGAGDSFISNIETELTDIDASQAALQNMVMETKKQINDSLKSKINGLARIEGLKKAASTVQQELDAKKETGGQQYKEEMSAEAKMISYNKEKLLAAMKAIDNNENVDCVELQKSQRGNGSNRSQITENLYRGVPTHAKKKDDLIKELFGDGKGDTKNRNGCTKMH